MSNPQLSACLRLLGTPQDPNHAQAVAQLEAWESQSACELISQVAPRLLELLILFAQLPYGPKASPALHGDRDGLRAVGRRARRALEDPAGAGAARSPRRWLPEAVVHPSRARRRALRPRRAHV